MNKFIAGSIVSIGLTAATVALSAQTVTPPGAGGQTMQHGERHHGKRAFSMPGERVEARLAYMKTALKITDAQQAQWNAFADVARKQAAARDKRIQEFRSRMAQGDAKHERPNAIARLERQQQRLNAAVTSLNERLAVEKPLYAALSPEQKAVADEVLAPRGHHHGFGHRGNRSFG
jgi:hypothetical protein